MNSIRVKLDALIEKVPDNDTKRFDCPRCRGVNSLSITKAGHTVQYNCFHAACRPRLAGTISVTPKLDDLKAYFQPDAAPKKSFKAPAHLIKGVANKRCLNYLQKVNAIDAYKQGLFTCGYDPVEDRFLFLITNTKNEIIGAVGRFLGWKAGEVKTKNYSGSTGPFICGKGETLVLVEDCASACSIACNPKYTGCALAGTNMQESDIAVIVKYSRVSIALDRDARTKALNLKRKLSYYHNNVELWLLEKDFKDMTKEEIYERY